MTPDDHRRLRTDLGAYALGQLPAAEARRVEEHLAGCELCRAEHEELVPVAGALASLRPTGTAPAVPTSDDQRPAPDLEDRVVRRLRDERRSARRHRVVRSSALLVAGAAAASVVLSTTVGLGGSEPVATVPLEAVEVAAQEAGIQADADLVAHTWGVEVKLTASGFVRGGRYRVVIVGEDGREHPAGGFVGTGAVEMHCNLNSTVLRDRAAGFEVTDSRGRVVATSTFEA